MTRIYYAHSKMIYNTQRETDEWNFLKTMFKKVLCPNKDIGERGAIEPYLEEIRKCDGLVCSEYKGHIGRGVYEEIKEALETNMEVLCLRKYEGQYILRPVSGVKTVDEDDWKVEYGKVILKSAIPNTGDIYEQRTQKSATKL